MAKPSKADRVDGWYTIYGQKYASVTAALNLLPKPGLASWRLRKAAAAGDPDAPDREALAAAARGSRLHDIFDGWAKTGKIAEAAGGEDGWVSGFKKFVEEHKPKPIRAEATVWAEAPEGLFAGTLDAVVEIDGKAGPLDYKTVSRAGVVVRYPPFVSQWAQVEAYRRAIGMSGGEWLQYKYILRLGPDGSYRLSRRYAPTPSDEESQGAWRLFRSALGMWYAVRDYDALSAEIVD